MVAICYAQRGRLMQRNGCDLLRTAWAIWRNTMLAIWSNVIVAICEVQRLRMLSFGRNIYCYADRRASHNIWLRWYHHCDQRCVVAIFGQATCRLSHVTNSQFDVEHIFSTTQSRWRWTADNAAKDYVWKSHWVWRCTHYTQHSRWKWKCSAEDYAPPRIGGDGLHIMQLWKIMRGGRISQHWAVTWLHSASQ